MPTEDGADVCAFCRTYTPPPTNAEADRLIASAYSHTQAAADDAGNALDILPEDAPLLAVVDLVTAIAHMKAARRCLDKAGAGFGAAQVVRR
ncbi:hypothetical protein BKN37_12755 [Mycobacterium talmoniae]|uniref:Uncharacterized protein n=1 Tax=Mycobacterium talmoniae TaxID=1858794 RepID=A0A1S1NHK6_9MYCO|nr:hypothetical protein BKN37_12755 [Mycobacterium talmoniae]